MLAKAIQSTHLNWRCVGACVSPKSLWLGMLLWLVGGWLVNGQSLAAQISQQQMLQKPENISVWLAKKRIRFEEIPNPHWKDSGCIACHSKTPAGKSLNLRGKSIDAVCENCHSGVFDHSYIHPSGVPLKADMKQRISLQFADNLDKKNNVSCATCHEIKLQCLKEHRAARRTNPMFFRGGPYKARTDLCYQCHDINGYQRRNAHDQIDDHGKIKKNSCLICHDKLDGLDYADSIEDVGFYYKGSLVRVCGSCHELKPHPSGNFSFTSKGTPNHLVVPPENIKKKMLQSEKERGVVLPLDPNTGRVFCGTCHNPHEKGVIKGQAAAKGADEKNRLRTQNICTNCHDK